MVKFCNRVLKLEGISYKKINAPAEIGPAMKKFIELHQDRWQRAGRKGALAEKAVQEFHIEAAQRLARYLDLKQLTISDRVIATAYSYDYRGSRQVYLPGMDMEYGDYSLGFVMMAFGIKDAIENSLKEFDFMRGGEEYKFHFTKTVRTNAAYYFAKNPLKFKIFCLLEKL
jgi:CelD/BcsL family acetyltransferase involved in cellulose biosynthesis